MKDINYHKDVNKVTCLACGHVNYTHTDDFRVTLFELTTDDIGLQVRVNGASGILRDFGASFHPQGGFNGYVVLEENLIAGFLDSDGRFRENISDPNQLITIARPVRPIESGLNY